MDENTVKDLKFNILSPDLTIEADNIDLEGDNISIIATDSTKKAHLTIKCTKKHI